MQTPVLRADDMRCEELYPDMDMVIIMAFLVAVCLDESTRTSWSGTPTTGVASVPFYYCVKGSQQILRDRKCGKKKKKQFDFSQFCSQSLTWREHNQWMKWRN